MKNLFLGLVMLVSAASFANTEDPIKKLPVVPATTTEKVETVVETPKVEDDALYCRVTNGYDTLSCWFCNCTALADRLQAL